MHVCSPPLGRARAAAFLLLFGLVAGIGSVSALHAQCSADPWADVVVSSTPTTGDPAAVLGPPDGVLVDFENDGNEPGFVILAFADDLIVDGAGADLAIHVSDFAASEWPEAFELLVSPGGVLWASLGIFQPTSPFQNQPETFLFDLQPTGLPAVSRVKILNTTADPNNANEGVDLDSVEALHCVPATDTDLEACQDDLDACSTELLSCDRELDDAVADLDACRDDLQAVRADLQSVQADLDACDDALAATAHEMEEIRAGVAEVRRLLELPPGRRSSDFTCSGQVCHGLMKIIDVLVAPPGHEIRHQKGRRHRGSGGKGS